ncbi:MAG: glutamate mutase L, partial [Youngiibacter sp.]|nr:glutamate mutase L [Youngiibacter sp.]
MRDSYLFIDFGSTYTKLTAVDANADEVIATGKAYTTVETDVQVGYLNAMKELEGKTGELNYIKKLACSSAAGGLKIIAIGLVPELTAEAAKRAALGAGARVIKVYSFKLNRDEMRELKGSNADMILLAGGTNGGNSEVILHNAKMIRDFEIGIPVVVA